MLLPLQNNKLFYTSGRLFKSSFSIESQSLPQSQISSQEPRGHYLFIIIRIISRTKYSIKWYCDNFLTHVGLCTVIIIFKIIVVLRVITWLIRKILKLHLLLILWFFTESLYVTCPANWKSDADLLLRNTVLELTLW